MVTLERCAGLVLVSLMTGCLAPGPDSTNDSSNEEMSSSEQGLTGLGGLNLDAQCRRRHGSSAFAVLLQPVISPGAAYAWRCFANGVYNDIDMQLFCRWQYNNASAFAAYGDFNNAYSWSCYLP
jgi:hypothetical protein